ncbi:MAG TPA: hypothetical protein VJS44_23315 [Pyrinomonadaceae bacterium]|nr:hypothetical protein [Pyrinomonadaceae bacterium]
MPSIKRFLAIAVLAVALAPAALAQGTAESPGVVSTPAESSLTVSAEGTAESPGYFGTAESPGFMTTVFIYLGAVV